MEEKPDVTFESHETAHEFVITFRRKSDQVSDQVANQVTNQEMNQVTNQVTHQVTHQESVQEGVQVSVQEDVQGKRSKDRLTKAQKDIVNFCSIPRSAEEILERIGLTNQTFNRKKHIQPLATSEKMPIWLERKTSDG